MTNKLRQIIQETGYSYSDNSSIISNLIELADKWCQVEEIWKNPLKSPDDALDFISRNTDLTS